MIKRGEWYVRYSVLLMWEDIQRHARPDQDLPHSEAKELINWFVTVDLKTLKPKTEDKSIFPEYRFLYRKYLPYSLYRIGKIISTKIHQPAKRD